MTQLVPIALVVWIPISLCLFFIIPPRRALISTLIVGWLVLPCGQISFVGMPEITKATSISIALILGTIFFCSDRINHFRPSWMDLPMLIWCVCPFLSSLSNNLGLYDGLSGIQTNLIWWGIPYLVGRICFSDRQWITDLAIGILIGAVLYIPICLWELRMSPQLHRIVYGYHQFGFVTTVRGSGWRPVGFMSHGLELGLWLTSATIIGLWLLFSRSLHRIFGIPLKWILVVLTIISILCRSYNGLVLMILGIFVLWSVRKLKITTFVLLLTMVPILYMTLRSTEFLPIQPMLNLAAAIDKGRAESLGTRLRHEGPLMERAWQRPIFGWGAWGRSRIKDHRGRDISITDGWWIITFGQNGLFGLCALYTALLMPSFFLFRLLNINQWHASSLGAVTALAVVVPLYSIDCLMNAFLNPVYHLVIGALASAAIGLKREPIRYLLDSTPTHSLHDAIALPSVAPAHRHPATPSDSV